MGILGGFSYQEVASKLRYLGCVMLRQGKGSHEIWINKNHPAFPALGEFVIPKHKEMKEGTLREILKQAGISRKDFIDA